jgi:tetratricopeptide (TPR) repeat protein
MSRYGYHSFFVVVGVVFGAALSSPAQMRDQYFVGARPLALGETFVAIADDGNAIHWNPAGLPYIDHYELNSMFADLFNTGIKNNYASLFVPLTEKFAAGIDWFNLGFKDDDLDFSHNAFTLATGYRLRKNVTLGANLKYLTGDASAYGQSLGASLHGWGVDFGVLLSPMPRLQLGAMLHDATNTKVTYETNVTETLLKRNLRYGVSYRPLEALLVAADIDDRLHFGAEYRLPWIFAVRGGLQKDRHTEEPLTYSFGIGLAHKISWFDLQFDYAYLAAPSLENSNRFSAGVYFSFPSPVKIASAHVDDIYASLYNFYNDKPIGAAKLHYTSEDTLDYKVRVALPDFQISGDNPVTLLPPRRGVDSTQTVILKANFTNKILEHRNNLRQRAEIVAQPSKILKVKADKSQSQAFMLYGRGYINWAKGAEQAAAFVTPADPAVRKFAERALEQPVPLPDDFPAHESIVQAMQIFNTLHVIDYLGDASTFARGVTIDKVLYPRELLQERRGDCDDTTVLYAALLESIGIRTALVDVPRHILMMFDTGISKRRRFLLLPFPLEMFVVRENRLWLPVETTWMDSSFARAWERGVQKIMEWKSASTDKYREIDVHEAWETYAPGDLPEKASFDFSGTNGAQQVTQNIRALGEASEKHIAALKKRIAANPEDFEARNELATIHAMRGKRQETLGKALESKQNYQEAEKLFRETFRYDPQNFAAMNNLANLYFLQGNLDSAAACYWRAESLAADSIDRKGLYLNLGTLYAASETAVTDTLAEEMYARVVRSENDLSLVTELIGIDFEEAETGKAAKPVSDDKVKKKIRETLKKVPSKPSAQKPSGKTKSRPAGRKSRQPQEIENVFYWAGF